MPNSGLQNIYIMYGDSIPNYFNRRILFYGSLEDYLTAAGDNYELHEEVNFNPADGVNTYLDVVTDMGDKFSYLLLVDPEDGEIISRWFILEADRNLGGQYRFTLRRDVVAESLGNTRFITSAPVYVEKGILSDNDPMIVNSEGMTFNQIKNKEILLDRGTSKWGWIVGYFESGAYANNITVNATTIIPEDTTTAAEIAAATGIDVATINNILTGSTVQICNTDISIVFGTLNTGPFPIPVFVKNELYIKNETLNKVSSKGAGAVWSWNEYIGSIISPDIGAGVNVAANYIENNSASDMLSALNDVISHDFPTEVLYTNTALQSLNAFAGKKISIGGEWYEITGIDNKGTSQHAEIVVTKNENAYFEALAAMVVTPSEPRSEYRIYINYGVQDISIAKKPYSLPTGSDFKTQISSSALPLEDAPYSMFVIPFGDPATFVLDGPETIANRTSITKSQALAIASAIATALGNQLYDIQLLPYSPPLGEFEINITNIGGGQFIPILYGGHVAYVYDEDTQTYVSSGKEGLLFDFIKNSNNDNVGIIMYLQQSNFTFSLFGESQKLYAEDSAKIESQCNFYRLCAPNYSSVFEFNLAKNGMSVESFEVNCTYKPVNPFIRIQPSFKGLYGSSFMDGRGLICGGDFSLPIIKDAWVTYQQNNKNFANIFARDIQNLDVMQKQERINEALSLGAGVVGGGAAGAMTGAKAGPYGAIAGAAIGTAVGAIGAGVESALGAERRAEAKDYAIDRFNMNLQNIKALPQTLVRNSSFSIINKIFPFLEYYSCTQEEKDALQRKIDLDGMTVGRIDYTANFISEDHSASKYFKGQLIRAEGLDEDTHYINALYDEIAKGVYI